MGRIPTVPIRKYQLQHMWERHHEMKRLALLGYSNKQIAEHLGCTPENVCAVTGSELFKREIQCLKAARDCAAVDVARAIAEIGPKCLSLLENVMDNNIDATGEKASISLRAHVAQDLLDRHAKTAKVKHIDGDIQHTHVVGEDIISKIKERAKAVEAEFEIIGQRMQANT